MARDLRQIWRDGKVEKGCDQGVRVHFFWRAGTKLGDEICAVHRRIWTTAHTDGAAFNSLARC